MTPSTDARKIKLPMSPTDHSRSSVRTGTSTSWFGKQVPSQDRPSGATWLKPSSNQATSIWIAQRRSWPSWLSFASWPGVPVVGGCMTFNIENISSEIRDINQWVRWKLVTKSDDKPTKIPYDTNGGEPPR